MADFPAFLLPSLIVAQRPTLPLASGRMCEVRWRYQGLDGQPVENRRTLFANIFSPLHYVRNGL